ncbi:MAG: TerB family tellurite resistance protein [Parvularculaceae bacterium]
MHIVIAVLGAVAAAFWAFVYFTNAARSGREAVRDVRGMVRRGAWSRRIDKRLIENLSDPREAAAVLLFQVAAYDGAATERQKAAMISQMQQAFEADEETVDGLYAFARMAVGEINDASNSLRKILRPVCEICTQEEKQALIDMLTLVGQVEGPLNDPQNRLIDETRRALATAP